LIGLNAAFNGQGDKSVVKFSSGHAHNNSCERRRRYVVGSLQSPDTTQVEIPTNCQFFLVLLTAVTLKSQSLGRKILFSVTQNIGSGWIGKATVRNIQEISEFRLRHYILNIWSILILH
jgi:hypothetical protein